MSLDLNMEAAKARCSYRDAVDTHDALEEAARLASRLHDQLRFAGVFEPSVREMGVAAERHVFELLQLAKRWATEVDVREVAMRNADDRAEKECA